MERPRVLPPNLPPRLLSRDQAAEYCGGISLPLFDDTIAKKVPPIELHTRKLWDRFAIDAYLDEQSGLAPPALRPVDEYIDRLGKPSRSR